MDQRISRHYVREREGGRAGREGPPSAVLKNSGLSLFIEMLTGRHPFNYPKRAGVRLS